MAKKPFFLAKLNFVFQIVIIIIGPSSDTTEVSRPLKIIAMKRLENFSPTQKGLKNLQSEERESFDWKLQRWDAP